MPRVLPQPTSHPPRQVWLGLEVFKGGGVGGIITVNSAAAILACKTLYFGNPHAKTPHSCSRASEYQSIHAQATMTFMFESVPFPEHSCSKASHYQTIHAQAIITFALQVHPSARNTAPSGTKSMSFPGALMQNTARSGTKCMSYTASDRANTDNRLTTTALLRLSISKFAPGPKSAMHGRTECVCVIAVVRCNMQTP